jgi:hypothetical protein
MAFPPLLAGTDHERDTCALPAVAVKAVGADGIASGSPQSITRSLFIFGVVIA